jgi:hypothetical protein
MKDEASANRMFDLHIRAAPQQLMYETEGTVRYTVQKPLPLEGSSSFYVNTIVGYKNEAYFRAHN